MIQPNNARSILEGLKAFGPSPGAKKMLLREFKHAKEAMDSSIYMTWVSSEGQKDACFRIGSESRCFCGHYMKEHNKKMAKKSFTSSCLKCACKVFEFIPRRPEEVGFWHLPRRKGFDVNTWRAGCVCKHNHEDHNAGDKSHKCMKCKGCYRFTSDFACLNCDKKWEDHITLVEDEFERHRAGMPIGEEYLPLSTNKEIQQEFINALAQQEIEKQMSGLGLSAQPLSIMEEESKENKVRIELSEGLEVAGIPVSVAIEVTKKKNYAPKQDMKNPERSVRLSNLARKKNSSYNN